MCHKPQDVQKKSKKCRRCESLKADDVIMQGTLFIKIYPLPHVALDIVVVVVYSSTVVLCSDNVITSIH